MSLRSTPNIQAPHPMKKKVVIALLAVVVGHAVTLWGLNQIKAPELKAIEKEPIKVRLVKIKEDVPPPPPPPVEPIKPKVKPKPEPVPVPVVKPKVIAQKTEKIEPKVIQQDDSQQKKLLEQERLEKLRQQQLEQQERERQERDRIERERLERERIARETQERARLESERQNANRPRNVSEGQVSWSRKPVIQQNALLRLMKLEKGERAAAKAIALQITSDGGGNVTKVVVTRSTGIDALDNYVVEQTRKARFKPLKENGVAVPFIVNQSFALSVSN